MEAAAAVLVGPGPAKHSPPGLPSPHLEPFLSPPPLCRPGVLTQTRDYPKGITGLLRPQTRKSFSTLPTLPPNCDHWLA